MSLLALHETGLTYAEIAKMTGLTRCAVAGSIHRERNPYQRKGRRRGFRDPEAAKQQAALADEVGLCKAARMLGMAKGHLCRVRQRVRAMEASA